MIDMDATKYIGVTIQWDYEARKAHIHMPGYLQKSFTKFKHQRPTKIQNSPHPHTITHYGAKTQYADEDDTSLPLSNEDTKFVQAVAGTLLYYARAVDPTILPALSLIATKQAKPMQWMMMTIKQLLDYCAKQEEAIITYHTSKMILAVHSNVGYCNEKNSRGQVGGTFFPFQRQTISPK